MTASANPSIVSAPDVEVLLMSSASKPDRSLAARSLKNVVTLPLSGASKPGHSLAARSPDEVPALLSLPVPPSSVSNMCHAARSPHADPDVLMPVLSASNAGVPLAAQCVFSAPAAFECVLQSASSSSSLPAALSVSLNAADVSKPTTPFLPRSVSKTMRAPAKSGSPNSACQTEFVKRPKLIASTVVLLRQ